MGKKQKSRQGLRQAGKQNRKERVFEADSAAVIALRSSAEPARMGDPANPGEEMHAVAGRGSLFSAETIQQLIERIKSI